MGRHRDRRELRRHRFEDVFAPFPDSSAESRYFQQPPIASAPSIDAEVIWFNAEKGFGFVKAADGIEAYLHIRLLEAVGKSGVSEGTQLKVSIEEGQKGYQVSRIFEVGDIVAKPIDDEPVIGPASPARTDIEEKERDGIVKWYNADKGFGFIVPNGEEKDVFVHATALVRSELTELTEGQRVLFKYGMGRKGLEAWSIRII
ncbi:cold-shock protein [Mesorhizobium sp. SB112]|uniref:cold-shock protein n=1 Tax=Mesorhizobium sp. SB112 TaxID=3151853 RepID=UPI0032661B12